MPTDEDQRAKNQKNALASFSVINPSRIEGKFAYIKLNTPRDMPLSQPG